MNYRCAPTRHGQMLFDADDAFVGRALEAYGEYSWSEVEVLLQMCSEITRSLGRKPVVFEAGAHVGTMTLPLARAAARLYAFEPQRCVYKVLQRTIEANPELKITARCYALGSKPGFVKIPHVNLDDTSRRHNAINDHRPQPGDTRGRAPGRQG